MSIEPILDVVAAKRREEVVDEAVAAIAASSDAHSGVAQLLVDGIGSGFSSTVDLPSRREVILRAIARSTATQARLARVNIAYRLAHDDPSPAVRDVAVQVLVGACHIEGRAIINDLLRRLATQETVDFVSETIAEGLEELKEHEPSASASSR